MSDEQTQLMEVQNAILLAINESLQQIAASMMPDAPDYRRPLQEFHSFDWTSINAEVVTADQHGPSRVRWGGFEWLRRYSDHAKYGKAIWFSRTQGKTDEGETNYLCLIKFSDKTSDAEPIPADMLPAQAPARQAQRQTQPAEQHRPAAQTNGNGKPKQAQTETQVTGPPTNGRELLALLNQTEGAAGYYKDPSHIYNGIRRIIEGWKWPRPSDVDGWRDAFKLAKEYAEANRQPQQVPADPDDLNQWFPRNN